MSRTDKTQPFSIKLWDGTLARAARHDHRGGACDLPGDVTVHLAQLQRPASAGQCSWDLRFTGTRVCCCGLCRDQVGRRRAKKGSRRRARMALRDTLKRSQWRTTDLEEWAEAGDETTGLEAQQPFS